MALFRSMTKKSLVLAPMARSARQSVGSYPVLLNYSMTPSSRAMPGIVFLIGVKMP